MATLTYTDINNLSPEAQAYVQHRRDRGKQTNMDMNTLQQRALAYKQRLGAKQAISAQRQRADAFTQLYGQRSGSTYSRKKQSILDIMNDPDMQQYNDSYQGNFDAARSAVQNAFANAMSEINARGGAAGQVLDAMPGQLQSIYGNADQSMQASAAAVQQAQQASGLQPYMPASSYLAPVQMANQQDLAGRTAAIPLIRSGVEGALSKERQSAQSDYDQSMADIAEREAAARQQNQGPNWMQDLFIQDAMNQDPQTDNPKWGQGYVGTDRGGDELNRRPLFAQALRSQAAHPRAQMAYNAAMAEFTKLRQKGKDKNSNAMHTQVEKLRKQFGKYMGAINIALVDAGYS